MFQSLQKATCIERKMCQMCQLVPKKGICWKKWIFLLIHCPPPFTTVKRMLISEFIKAHHVQTTMGPVFKKNVMLSCMGAEAMISFGVSLWNTCGRQANNTCDGGHWYWLGRICSSNAVQNQLSGLPSSTECTGELYKGCQINKLSHLGKLDFRGNLSPQLRLETHRQGKHAGGKGWILDGSGCWPGNSSEPKRPQISSSPNSSIKIEVH